MGNAQSLTRTSGALDSFVAELGTDLVYDKSLGSARFLKTVKCRHRNGYVVVKIFIKRDPGESLRSYQRRLKTEREALIDIPNVYNYQAFVETERAGYIIRQWVASNLYDRISTRPFLSLVEKKWIAFQILTGLRDARNRKVSHGDIKSENILVTSWNWVYISDFSSFKPTYLPLDDPSDFSFYFDTSGRRTCYLAPERFYTSTAQSNTTPKKTQSVLEDEFGDGKRASKVTEAMDCFSTGCVLAELFLEGEPLFTLSQLFKYREGEYNIEGVLATIEDEGVRNMIKKMVALDSTSRPTFDVLLHTSRGSVFPEAFYSFLHNYAISINELPGTSAFAPPPPPTGTVSATGTVASPLVKTPGGMSVANADPTVSVLPSDADNRLDRIWSEYESVEPFLESSTPKKAQGAIISESPSGFYADLFPVELSIPNRDKQILPNADGTFAPEQDGAALIVLSMICSNIRSCRLPSSRLKALDLFLAMCPHLTDESKLDRMLPYLVDLLHDESADVRAAALRTLIQLTLLVTVITPFNAAIFPEYIIPNAAHLIRDPEESVRSMYAQCIVPLADTALRYLEMGQALRSHGAFQRPSDGQDFDEAHVEVTYEAARSDLHNQIQEHLAALLMDPASVVKRAVLHNISSLCIFLGVQTTNDVLLSHMITYLNDRDWLLRLAFFESIVDVAACAGGRSLEEYILPLMVQALSDVEETVVAQVLASLTSLCEVGLFQKMRIWELMGATINFLYHPNIWIRQGTVAFMASAAKQLPSTDAWCILYPSLRHFLKSDIHSIDEETMLMALKLPLTRQVFDATVQWAMRAGDSPFWKGQRRSGKSNTVKESMMASRRTGVSSSRPSKSEDDEANLTKLRLLGMGAGDESKLNALREYLAKLSNAISSFPSRLRSEADAESLKTTGNVELQKLKVMPQTVFLKPRSEMQLRSPQAILAQRRVSDFSSRGLVPGSPRIGSRRNSIDPGGTVTGAPFEDLRRRLATINGTTNALSPATRTSTQRTASTPSGSTLATPDVPDFTPPFERPGSPAESVVSTANSSAFRAMHRHQVGISESTKAAPAVGSSRANATGMFENAATIRSETSPERNSGIASPMSVTDTFKMQGMGRLRVPSLVPHSSNDGQEQGIAYVLDHLYVDNTRELQSDFGPAVHDGPLRRRTANRNPLIARDGTSRRPEATLIAHLASHSDAIVGFTVAPDHTFFVSGSTDGTVRVWDSARLERNVTAKPRHTYNQHHAPITALTTIEGTHCFASASRDGSLHVVRVHVALGAALPKYGKLQVVREHRVGHAGEYITSMVHYNTDTASTLIYSTTEGLVSVLDLRTMRVLQTLENPRHHGPITAILVDRKRSWVLTGSAAGILALWDLRFGLNVRTWKAGASVSGPSSEGISITTLALHPTRGKGRWVVIAFQSRNTSGPGHDRPEGESTQVEIWDIERGVMVERYLSLQPITDDSSQHEQLPGQAGVGAASSEETSTPATAIAAMVRRRQAVDEDYARPSNTGSALPAPPSAETRALLLGVDLGGAPPRSDVVVDLGVEGASPLRRRGYMITGAEDRRVRIWDLNKVEHSVVLSGPPPENNEEHPTYTSLTDGSLSSYLETWPARTTTSAANRPAARRALVDGTQQALLRAHSDTVCAVAVIDAPFRGGLITGDRAGVIKVWRIEGSD